VTGLFPDRSLVLLVGPPAAGKSTLAAELIAAGVVDAGDVLSSDAYRQALTGDERDTSLDRRMWVQLRRDLIERMAAGRTTIVDATNVFPRRRARHIRVAKAHDRPVVAVRFHVRTDELLARNEERRRQVHDAAIVEMAEQADTTGDDDLLAEGVSEVIDAERVRRHLEGRPG
jgi:predicted kinase